MRLDLPLDDLWSPNPIYMATVFVHAERHSETALSIGHVDGSEGGSASGRICLGMLSYNLIFSTKL